MATTTHAPRPVGAVRKLASAVTLGYLRNVPVERGKWRLMNMAKSFVVCPIEPGLFVRLSGLSHVEVKLFRDGAFEKETLEAFASLLAPGMTVLDLGANIGLYTLVAAKRVGKAGSVHAFEPCPQTVANLEFNVALNGLENVTVNAAAVSTAPGRTRLFFGEDAGEHSIVIGGESESDAMTEVEVTSIDDYTERHGLSRVDVIKMDIEGAEPLALAGGRRLLTSADAPLLVLELNPKTLTQGGSSAESLLALLADLGYRFYPIATYGRETHDPWTNGFAFKPNHFERFGALNQWRTEAAAAV